jgi:hypothetical protein
MAVKRPPNTWVSQVLTLKGFRDEVYSEIDGSLVGYIKDGKFIQTIDELPKLDPKKKKQQDPAYVARLKESQAKLAINILRQSAVYYKELAEDVERTPKERADAKTKLDDINRQIETRSKEAGQAVETQTAVKAVKDSASATKRGDEIKIEFDKLQEQRDAVLDPKDPKVARIKAQQDVLAEEYAKLQPIITKRVGSAPISKTAAFGILAGTLAGDKTVSDQMASQGPTGTQGSIVTPSPTLNRPGTPTPTPAPTPTPTPKPTPTPAPNKKPSGPTGPTGAYTAQQAADLAATVGGTNYFAAKYGSASDKTVGGYDAALALAQEKYNLPDILFSNVKSLGDLLDRYVNADSYGKEGIADINQFIQLVKNDTWYRTNSEEIKTRYLQKFNYDDLVKSGQAKGTTDYEMQIAKITNNLIKKARELGSAVDEGQAKLIAEDLYIHNQDADDAVVTRRLVSGIRPIAGMVAGRITEDYSGLALQNYQGLQAIAKRNGFKLEDILPRGADGKPMPAQETLKRIALGELDPTRLEQDVRKLAAIGQPQFVRDLLGQGIDLEEIYAPYRKTMANILELDQGQIDLNDPTLRMGINDKGDVNLYDYAKELRKDSRWQYTGNAREKVSDAALTVLRNFGFQG